LIKGEDKKLEEITPLTRGHIYSLEKLYRVSVYDTVCNPDIRNNIDFRGEAPRVAFRGRFAQLPYPRLVSYRLYSFETPYLFDVFSISNL